MGRTWKRIAIWGLVASTVTIFLLAMVILFNTPSEEVLPQAQRVADIPPSVSLYVRLMWLWLLGAVAGGSIGGALFLDKLILKPTRETEGEREIGFGIIPQVTVNPTTAPTITVSESADVTSDASAASLRYRANIERLERSQREFQERNRQTQREVVQLRSTIHSQNQILAVQKAETEDDQRLNQEAQRESYELIERLREGSIELPVDPLKKAAQKLTRQELKGFNATLNFVVSQIEKVEPDEDVIHKLEEFDSFVSRIQANQRVVPQAIAKFCKAALETANPFDQRLRESFVRSVIAVAEEQFGPRRVS